MNRRDFLRLGATASLAMQLPGVLKAGETGGAGLPAALPPGPLTQVDVFVYGSTPGGIAAAVAAARQGCRVILACPKKHAGGMLASGLGGLDAHRRDLSSGFVTEFRQRMQDIYQRRKEAGAPEWQLKARKRGGNEPSAVEAMFDAMLAEQAGRLDHWRGNHLLAAATRNGRITEVSLESPDGTSRRVAAARR